MYSSKRGTGQIQCDFSPFDLECVGETYVGDDEGGEDGRGIVCL